MKRLVYFGIAGFALSSSLAIATPQSIKDQNDHYKAQQRQSEIRRQDTNRSVNRNIQTQRYNATRPTTTYRSPPPQRYTPPPQRYTPPPRPTTSYNRKY